jgi:hypothetical protein
LSCGEEAAQYACSNSKTSATCAKTENPVQAMNPCHLTVVSIHVCYKDLSPKVSLPTADWKTMKQI